MSLGGSSLLTRVAINPRCEVQVAMSLSGDSEPAFYKKVTGLQYDREFGERLPARRRGAKFERNLFQNDAAMLREVLAPVIGKSEDQLYVRNLEDEVPGNNRDTRVTRYSRTRRIIKDAISGQPRPEIVIHPELLIQIPHYGPIWIEPDFMVLNPARKAYLPGDAKSFVVQENDVDSADLERTRLQIAAQITAMKFVFDQFGEGNRVDGKGMLIFSSPHGLRPHPPKIEDLDGAIHSIQSAIDALIHHKVKIDTIRAVDRAEMHLLISDLDAHFQEKCVNTCILSEVCQQNFKGKAQELGDVAVNLLGEDADLDRVLALMSGAVPVDQREEKLSSELMTIAETMGFIRRVA